MRGEWLRSTGAFPVKPLLPRTGGGWPRFWAWVLLAAGLAALGLWLLLRVWPEVADPTWERIQETRTLLVCTDPSWPPFEFVDAATGQIQGLDVDLANRLAARLVPGGVAQTVTVGFDSLYDALLAGRCDAVLSALPYEPLRTQDVSYSVSYFNAGLVVVVPAGASAVETLDDLAGRVVAVEWGFVPEGDARQRLLLRSLGPRRYDTAGDALRALQAGEADTALVDRIAALTYLQECGGLRIEGRPLSDVNYVIPVRPDSFRLLEEINRALLDMRGDGTLADLERTWF